ncbi:GL22346 [Drosophila persimilis]|uniref:GL22346 n=1 Tax=Drosophila persimilis TaxID=7234 RepID=B4GDW8_DROPE|nr:GL22346 [Drosophila persimilis]
MQFGHWLTGRSGRRQLCGGEVPDMRSRDPYWQPYYDKRRAAFILVNDDPVFLASAQGIESRRWAKTVLPDYQPAKAGKAAAKALSKRQRRKVAKVEEGNGQGRQIILVLNEESVRLLHDTEGTVDYGYKKVVIVEPPEIPSMEIKPVSVSDEASVVSDDILDGWITTKFRNCLQNFLGIYPIGS